VLAVYAIMTQQDNGKLSRAQIREALLQATRT
jgi:hypothetical protein